MSPEKLDLHNKDCRSLEMLWRCIMTGYYLHNIGAHHLKAPDDLILCGRYELEGQQNEDDTNKSQQTLACAKQPGGHLPVTEQGSRSAASYILSHVQCNGDPPVI